MFQEKPALVGNPDWQIDRADGRAITKPLKLLGGGYTGKTAYQQGDQQEQTKNCHGQCRMPALACRNDSECFDKLSTNGKKTPTISTAPVRPELCRRALQFF